MKKILTRPYMKTWTSFLISWLFLYISAAGQVGINPTGSPPDPSAGLDVDFSDKGYLQPRLTYEHILAIPAPATGLMLYNLDHRKPMYFDGVIWRNCDGTLTWSGCGELLEIMHGAGYVAPQDKGVAYGTVTGIPGEPDKCWITSNLGAGHQATAVDDASEAAAGWYWQFNRKQGFMHDGVYRTPDNIWETNISENSDWLPANDPCNLELANGWRIPTETEWFNVYTVMNGNWTDWTGPWNSALHLHAAGYIDGLNRTLNLRGLEGHYWSNSHGASSLGRSLKFTSSACGLVFSDKKGGKPLRCVKCESPALQPPAEGTHVPWARRIVWNWIPVAGADGYRWNLTDDYNSAMELGNSTTKAETGLNGETTYTRFVWAYDECGRSASTALIATTDTALSNCEDSITVNHITGDIAPVTKTTVYHVATDIPGEPYKCWITSNLGADRQALSANDTTEASAGWYWQFNRKQGYKHDGTNRTPGTTWTEFNEDSEWIPANDPCNLELGNGWRIPTATEWANVSTGGLWYSPGGSWNSELKIHLAGYLQDQLQARGSEGMLWSSVQDGIYSAYHMWLFPHGGYIWHTWPKTSGASIRCIKCSLPAPEQPLEGTHEASASWITWNWSEVTNAAGYKWNTENNFETASDLGIETSKVENGLTYGTSATRYIWAYNECDTHSGTVTLNAATLPFAFTCGVDSLVIEHAAGIVAPVSKIVTYGTATNISGDATKCWITSNLGASHQASAVNDDTEASAGWYWQFNRKQGYMHNGAVRTPDIAWQDIVENSDWTAVNDPCVMELGNGWRIPTANEWTTAYADGGWADWSGPWNSDLKLHAAGHITDTIQERGSYGRYWSSSQNSSDAAIHLYFSNSNCYSPGYYMQKNNGLPLRCLKCLSSDVPSPAEGLHDVSSNWITWRWDQVNGIDGYKLNTVNDLETAMDMGNSRIFTETGLIPETSYSRYVWAYSSCGNSPETLLTATTDTVSPGCGDTLTINHIAGDVSPVSKSVQYLTVSDIPGEPDKCWITSNLGADHQATAVNDATEASAGWYWQFNRKQGYKFDGSRIPYTYWTDVNENSDWTSNQDPCSIELGIGWRIPTGTEWINVDAALDWTDWEGPWESPLKMHAAGLLWDSWIYYRGSDGMYWSSNQIYETMALHLNFHSYTSDVGGYYSKGWGMPVRCIK